MFKRLKNWLFNRPPEDHLVASFGWVVGTFAAIGSAVAFPAIASVAVGVASFTYLMALAEGAYGIGGMIGNFCNWAYRKIFKSKKQPVNNQNHRSKSDKQPQTEQEKAKDNGREQPQPEKENGKGKEQPQPGQEKGKEEPQAEQKNDKGKEQPQPGQDKTQEQPQTEPVEPKQQPITLNSKEFLILIRQMQILMQLLQQTRMELEALRQQNKSLSSENKNPDNLKQFGNSEESPRRISGRRNPANRNYLQYSRFVRY